MPTVKRRERRAPAIRLGWRVLFTSVFGFNELHGLGILVLTASLFGLASVNGLANPPTVTFTSPDPVKTNSYAGGAVIPINVQASDVDGAVTNLVLSGKLISGNPVDLGTLAQAPTNRLSFVFLYAADGIYEFTAVATDNLGASATNGPLIIQVVRVPVPPTLNTGVTEGQLANAIVVNPGPLNNKTNSLIYTTKDGTALAGRDYVATTGTLTFKAGETSQTVSIPVNPQTASPPAKSFYINLSGLSNGTLAGKSQGVGTILPAVPLPAISISDVTLTAPTNGTSSALFMIGLSAAGDQVVTVNYATADNTAGSPGDYLARSGTLTFGAGETNKLVAVVVNAQTINQPAKTFFLNLNSATNATLGGKSQGVGTILAGIPMPSLSTVIGLSDLGLTNLTHRYYRAVSP